MIDLKKASKIIDKFINEITKEKFEAWVIADNTREKKKNKK